MVGVRMFCWFVLTASRVLLTTDYLVSLKCVLVEQPFAIYVALPLHSNVHQLKRCALPKIVAGVNKFVDAAVKPTLYF